MFSQLTWSVSTLSFLSLAASQTIQFDGRIPVGTQLADFDATNTFFGNKNVFGQNLTFSKLLQLPNVQPSLFDSNSVPVEVTIRYVDVFHSFQIGALPALAC